MTLFVCLIGGFDEDADPAPYPRRQRSSTRVGPRSGSDRPGRHYDRKRPGELEPFFVELGPPNIDPERPDAR